ncbi:MAG TPA: cyclic nucleotide-binding domain-containing protein [Blastocatellia bacterium]|nr:cyclic nucleotide-binding domain-containing protein [Blastocatellia bacterium]
MARSILPAVSTNPRSESAPGQTIPHLADDIEAKLLSYPVGTELLSEGESPRGLLVMYDGLAELSMLGSNGKSLFLGLATPGELLGLGEAISGKPSPLTAVALRRCKVALIEREDFLRYIQEHNMACFQAAKRLGKQLSLVYQRARSF